MSQKQGLKPPTKIGRPTGLPKPGSGTVPQRAQNALQKSARAAGLSTSFAEQYAAQLTKQYPGPGHEATPPPVDDFKIGDRVFVGGTKSGIIAFIGETKFAPGEWAGVVLDQPVGKNDGSVAGVRYFQCEAKRGVFSRCSKLSKIYVEGGLNSAPPPGAGGGGSKEGSVSSTGPVTELPPPSGGPPPSATPAKNTAATNGGAPEEAAKVPSAAPKVGATPKTSGLMKKGTISGSQSNLASRTPHGSTTNIAAASAAAANEKTLKHNLVPGDRVLVSGSKSGILRYVGTTDFAKGEWAGVDLDDALGKNDGTVAGKRYFECKPLHGLFAPVHKVCKVLGPLVTNTPRRSSISKYGGLSRERSGSQDSISSIGSSASTASRSRQTKTSSLRQHGATNLQATTTALQKALKEKEEHIEQLLRERDLERSEVARAAAQTDEAENQLMIMKGEFDRYISSSEEQLAHLNGLVDGFEKEKRSLALNLEEEKRKVEDLQFTIEETVIDKEDIERETEEDSKKLQELQAVLDKEKERADKLQQELDTIATKVKNEDSRLKEAEKSTDVYLDQIEELTHKLAQAENKLKEAEARQQTQGKAASQVNEELAQLQQKETHLEDQLAAKIRENKHIQTKLSEAEEELRDSTSRREDLHANLADANEKLASAEFTKIEFETELQDLKSHCNELERQLEASCIKTSQLDESKSKLEHQISELMHNSGDSSQQLSLLNDQLIEKDRNLAELQAALSNSTQNIGKLNETIERMQGEGKREVEVLVSQHAEHLKTTQDKLDQTTAEVDKLTSKLTKAKEQFEEDQLELKKQKDAEVAKLQEIIHKKEEEVKTMATAAEQSSTITDQLKTEKEDINFEREKLEKKVKKLEGEKEALTEEKNKALAEKNEVVAENKQIISDKNSSQSQISVLQEEKDKLVAENDKLKTQTLEIETLKKNLHEEHEKMLREKNEFQAELQNRDLKLNELAEEVDKFTTECKKEKERSLAAEEEVKKGNIIIGDLKNQLTESTNKFVEMDSRLKILETEREALKLQVVKLKEVQQEKILLEEKFKAFNTQIEDLQKRNSKLNEDFEVERTQLKTSIETYSLEVQKRDVELKMLKDQMIALEGENSLMKSYKSTMQNLEQEKKNLEKRVGQLENSLAESEANANVITKLDSGDSVVTQLQEAKEASDQQIDFLNSVIIDLQRKTQELQARLEAMESGAYMNGSDDLSIELSAPKAAAPRLFCDICDEFDLHDTDDCPQQAMSDSPPASQFHGNRNEERPYCEICEAFGHLTANCDDEQTF